MKGNNKFLHAITSPGTALFLIIAYPLFFLWQGLDFTDTGFVLTGYQQIFNDPASVEATFRTWLSNIIGGAWIAVFGDSLGLFGYRLAGALLLYTGTFFSYLILKPLSNKKNLLWVLFLAMVLISRPGLNFNYNTLTSFFYLAGAYLLSGGLQRQNKKWLFFAGAVIGMNTFIRLPNLLGVGLVLVIFFYGNRQENPLLLRVKRSLNFAGGFFTAIALVLLVMKFLGHFDGYLNGLTNAFLMLKDPTGHHGGGQLLELWQNEHQLVLARGGLVLLNLAILTVTLTALSRFRNKLLSYAVIPLWAFLSVSFYLDNYLYWGDIIATVLAVNYIVLFLQLCKPGNARWRLFSLVGLIILALAPLGSNNGIYNSVYGMSLSMPLTVLGLLGWGGFQVSIKLPAPAAETFHFRITGSEMKIIKIVVIVLFLIFTLNSAYHYTYRETESRPSLNHTVSHQRLKWVYTTGERAKVVEELLSVLPNYVREGDYLLAYENIPLVHFLTKTKPYLYHPWPLLYNPAQLATAIEKAHSEKPDLPVVVRARGNTEMAEWPARETLHLSGSYWESRKVMLKFLGENDYKTVWQNEFFEILEP